MNESKATRYQRLRRRARAASVGSAALMLAIIALTPAVAWLAEFARALRPTVSPAWQRSASPLVLFVVLVVVFWELASLPAAHLPRAAVDSAYGQSAPQRRRGRSPRRPTRRLWRFRLPSLPARSS